MTTYFKKNETTACTCGEPKKTTEIYCYDCANYFASMVAPFVNANASVDDMNTELSAIHKT